ncbi:MAG: hypothetical protein FD189_2420 [Elusimicrobia bacterium]|nr:MAG: hypothetical protein FD154_986 [Elusimicrobiota bacterium]KAF0152986.1 MAG: hypothetical protein FD189_2420 [Elusimicrobiota bacterium]
MKIPLFLFSLTIPCAALAAGALEQLGGAAHVPPAPTAVASAVSESPDPNSAVAIAGRCPPPAAGEEKIWQSDFHWNYSLPEMKARFAEMYASPKRLDRRAYWDAAKSRLMLPHDAGRGGDFEIGPGLVKAVARHIERAFELDYIDAVFFPDMGHSHILVPDGLWAEKYSGYPVDRMSDLYRDMLADPRLKIFYHTAEQLKMLEDGQLVADERVRFRHKTRNISGPITADAELTVHQNPASAANTVHGAPGHHWWGAGFNFSAQKDGCFVYRNGGKEYRFDISLYDLPYDPGGGGAGNY